MQMASNRLQFQCPNAKHSKQAFTLLNKNWSHLQTSSTLTLSVPKVQGHRSSHDNLELKYHEAGKGWMFISASAWKNSTIATIGGVGILISPHSN